MTLYALVVGIGLGWFLHFAFGARAPRRHQPDELVHHVAAFMRPIPIHRSPYDWAKRGDL